MRVVKARIEEAETCLSKRGRDGSAPTPSARSQSQRSKLRVGIPRVLNIWSTHQFWMGFLVALGIDPRHLVFSETTSDEQGREFGNGRGTVDCCYPVKCMSGHYGELVFGQKHKIDVLLSPMIYSLPSFLHGHVVDSLACPRVMAAPENIKAGFLKEQDVFAEQGDPLRRAARLPCRAADCAQAAPPSVAGRDSRPHVGRSRKRPSVPGYAALAAFNQQMRNEGGVKSCNGAPKTIGPAFWSWLGPITWIPASATRSRSTSRLTATRSCGRSTCPPTPTSRVDVRRRHPERHDLFTVRHPRRLAVVLQRQHQRDPVGRQGSPPGCPGSPA